MRIAPCTPVTALAFACVAALAQDPLKSAPCEQAIAALQAARTGADEAAVELARQRASQVCLGGSGAATRPSPVARAPITVPAPVNVVPEIPAVQPPVPPVRVERPSVITHCDPGGCWDSNGTRLNRAGPVLIGPSGACTATGGFVHCP
jgi:hypothetical protein